MPILAREVSCYPEQLLDDLWQASDDRRWWVFYTKARQEKALARDLVAKDIPFYLPLVPKTFVYGKRRATAHVPLFTGYIFVCALEEERVSALMTNRVSQMIDVADPEQLVSDLRQVSSLIKCGIPLTMESRLEPGQRVRVRQGAFAGMEGTVLKRRESTRLLISVSFLQQGVSVEIDDFMLESIG